MLNCLTEIIRTGVVSSTNEEKLTAQIIYPDRDDLVSDDLKVIYHSETDKSLCMPKVGDVVLTIFNPIAPSEGYIIGKIQIE